MHFDQDLDATGLACPLPIVKTKKALAAMASGQVLRVRSSDAGTLDDLPEFARAGGHTLLHAGQDGDDYLFLLKKA